MDAIPTEGFDAALTLTDHLNHLPDKKRRELARFLEILFREIEQFKSTKLSSKKADGKVLRVVLYGSYARGTWVEDRSSGYRSDYDLLIVVNKQSFVEEYDLWEALEERLLQEQISHYIETPIIPIVHSLMEVNDQLARGRPFFVDIARDGITLYEKPGHPLAQPKELTRDQTKAEAQQYFDRLFLDASYGVKRAEVALADQMRNYAAFDLHQATERLYHCLLLTLTLYSPKSHRIKLLRSKAEDLDARLIAAWPRDTRFARRCFELLSRAYVEARYSPKYSISDEELEWLVARVKTLKDIVSEICAERLAD